MNGRLLKWLMIGLFSISALTGCFIHERDDYYRDRDRGYYHDRDDFHHYDRDDMHHRH
jgi:hypothetical protein